ncbi:hypothetical protein ACA910_001312 [Epithemia clementina (nom. ined.)]
MAPWRCCWSSTTAALPMVSSSTACAFHHHSPGGSRRTMFGGSPASSTASTRPVRNHNAQQAPPHQRKVMTSQPHQHQQHLQQQSRPKTPPGLSMTIAIGGRRGGASRTGSTTTTTTSSPQQRGAFSETTTTTVPELRMMSTLTPVAPPSTTKTINDDETWTRVASPSTTTTTTTWVPSTTTTESSSSSSSLLDWLLNDDDEAMERALAFGYSPLEACLTMGGDDRCLIDLTTGTNKYHISPQPVSSQAIVRGSCTCNAPTRLGYQAAQRLYQRLFLQPSSSPPKPTLTTPITTTLSSRWSVLSSSSWISTGTRNPTTSTTTTSTAVQQQQQQQQSLFVLDQELRNVMAEQRQRIADCLQLPPGNQVVLVPSGSDAEYIPVAIARTLVPQARCLVNVVAQVQEIGTGSSPAARLCYFSTHAPLVGQLVLTDDDHNDQNRPLQGAQSCSIHTIAIPARHRQDGTPVDTHQLTQEKIQEFLVLQQSSQSSEQQSQQQQQQPSQKHSQQSQSQPSTRRHGDNDDKDIDDDTVLTIRHGVFGGKTGLRDAVLPGTHLPHSLGVVDACQGRFSHDELQAWLAQDSLVLFTASKFYQAPPFCGAVIIPKGLVDRLARVKEVPPETLAMFGTYGLGSFITDKELPDCLHSWKKALQQHQQQHQQAEQQQHSSSSQRTKKNNNNIGLALRWEAGLAEMERLALITAKKDAPKQAAVQQWAQAVTDMIHDEPLLDAWCVERSIVSIRIGRAAAATSATVNGDSTWLNMSELRHVYRFMSLDVASLLLSSSSMVLSLLRHEHEILSRPVHLGQPVDVADSFAILRMALGVESLVQYLQEQQQQPQSPPQQQKQPRPEDDDSSMTILAQDRLAVRKLALVAKYLPVLLQKEHEQQEQQL